ncbi:MAG: HAD family hydrolase [Clostridia bacterium]|nr:HAD family hydrolase [Clostridia bacterium]
MKYSAVIWDMDGTILNTLEDLCDSVNYVLRKNGYEERTLEETRCSVGNGVRRLMELSVPNGENDPRFEELFADFKEHYAVNCRTKTRPYDGIDAVLDALKAKGIKMAVVSNKLDSAVCALARDFYPQMDFALGEIAGLKRKPAPDMVEKALAELGVSKNEAVYIGDSEVDVLTAKNSGLDCISVLWGFRTKEELLPHGASVFAKEPYELISLVTE